MEINLTAKKAGAPLGEESDTGATMNMRYTEGRRVSLRGGGTGEAS